MNYGVIAFATKDEAKEWMNDEEEGQLFAYRDLLTLNWGFMSDVCKIELKQILRSRWMQLVAFLFTFVFVAIVVIQQMALPDIEGFTRQTASFLSVLLFLFAAIYPHHW